jgi:hypothetical protein
MDACFPQCENLVASDILLAGTKTPKKFLKHFLAAAFLFMAMQIAHVARAATDDEEFARLILEKADQIRFPREGFQVDVSISTVAPNQSADVRKYRILTKGNDNTVVMITEPAAERGQIMLMRGRDLWVPEVARPAEPGGVAGVERHQF